MGNSFRTFFHIRVNKSFAGATRAFDRLRGTTLSTCPSPCAIAHSPGKIAEVMNMQPTPVALVGTSLTYRALRTLYSFLAPGHVMSKPLMGCI